MKNKPEKIFGNFAWWLGVVVVGISLGLTLQFVRAWTEPTAAPPNGNIGAPINTGPITQVKKGGDICVDLDGDGINEGCVSSGGGSGSGGTVSYPECAFAGGTGVVADDGKTICKIPGSQCPFNWKPYQNYSETVKKTCNSYLGNPAYTCCAHTGEHSWANIDPKSEEEIYCGEVSYSYSCNCSQICTGGYSSDGFSYSPYNCYDFCQTCSGTTVSCSFVCSPDITFIGCTL